ncbi:hypothetical protein F5Y05DRAFT_318544 [Hypoxylon sp. FL0543]|nr:hypothetical protein F5Y05DRAFT_318544 [Hypoxylon sp. FL0543]
MRVSSLLASVAGASAASAAVMRVAADSMGWNWAVTEWTAGCAGASNCHYDFNVTGIGNSTDYPATPSFKAYCSGQGEGAPYKACTATGESETAYVVAAKLLPKTNVTNGTLPQPHIQVSIQFTDLNSASTWWNYTGRAEAKYNQFVAPPMNFTIVPDEIFGVA